MREIYGFKRRFDLPAPGDWYMVECLKCGKVIKGSGLGIGSHRRACKGQKNEGERLVNRWVAEGKLKG
jgi:hypothetical protein